MSASDVLDVIVVGQCLDFGYYVARDFVELSQQFVIIQVFEPDAFEAVEYFEAELTLLPTIRQPLKDYFEAHVHMGTAEAMANVALMVWFAVTFVNV